MAIPYAELIGDPVAHTKSPAIHRFWLEKLGMAGDYRALQLKAEEVPAYLEDRRSDPDWRGCNVTMPLKRSVLPLIDDRSEAVTKVGAANIILPVEGRLVADNGDLPGFVEPLHRLSRKPGPALVIGSGGAARAACIGLGSLGYAPIQVAARTPAYAEAMLAELGWNGPAVTALDQPHPPVSLLVNASAMGMKGNAPTELDIKALPDDAVVYDLVYDPLETPLLAAARHRALATIDGLAMLIGQAAFAFALFFGAQPPRECDAELREMLAR